VSLTLAKVPSVLHDLTIKCSPSGITVLTDRRYKTRYQGNKRSCVDINGNLHLNRAEFEKSIKQVQPKKAKARVVETTRAALDVFDKCEDTEQNSIVNENAENNSENGNHIRIRCYTVNKKEVRGRIYAYMNTQKGKKELYFWTVSFPAGTADAICYQALNIWLTQLRKYGLLKEYIRITERQDGKRNTSGVGTGTLHYHLAIPHKMPVQRANHLMAITLRTFAKQGKIPYHPKSPQIQKYNGVDICKNRKTRRVVNFAIKKGARALASYLTKYVTKNNEGFEQLAWHCSRGFSNLFTGLTLTRDEFIKFGYTHFLNRVRKFEMPFAIFIPWLYSPPPSFEEHLYQLNSYLQSIENE